MIDDFLGLVTCVVVAFAGHAVWIDQLDNDTPRVERPEAAVSSSSLSHYSNQQVRIGDDEASCSVDVLVNDGVMSMVLYGCDSEIEVEQEK